MKYSRLLWLALWAVTLSVVVYLFALNTKYQPTFPYADSVAELPLMQARLAQFDGVHYLTIILQGYEGIGLIQAFFPVYPLIIESVSLGSNSIYTLVSLGQMLSVLSLVLVIWLWPSFEQWATQKKAENTYLWMLLWPASFFLVSLYPESLFILLVVATFLAAKNKRWLLAGLLAAVASGTRIVGIFLWPALLIELWWQSNQEHSLSLLKLSLIKVLVISNWKQLLGISVAPMGLLMYSLYLWSQFSDPLYFFHVQQEFGGGRQESLVLLPQVLFRYVKIIFTAQLNWAWYNAFQELLLSLFAFGALIFGWKKMRPSVWFYSVAVILLPTLTGTLSSMPRYILPSVGVYLLLGYFAKKSRYWLIIWSCISLVLLVLNLYVYAQGKWVA